MSRPDIFGIGLAEIIDNAMSDAGGSFPITLTARREGARDPANPTSGRAITSTPYGCRGFLDTKKRRGEGGVDQTYSVFVVFGNSLPAGVEPQAGDQITALHERTQPFTIVPGREAVRRDPAGATYECEVGP